MFLRRLRENSQPIAMLFAIFLAINRPIFIYWGNLYPSTQFQLLGMEYKVQSGFIFIVFGYRVCRLGSFPSSKDDG